MNKKVLDSKTLDYILRFCEEQQAGTNSRMVAASWDEVIEKLKELMAQEQENG